MDDVVADRQGRDCPAEEAEVGGEGYAAEGLGRVEELDAVDEVGLEDEVDVGVEAVDEEIVVVTRRSNEAAASRLSVPPDLFSSPSPSHPPAEAHHHANPPLTSPS